MTQINREEYLKLCAEIWDHNRRYYVENHPIISDIAFDALLAKVIEIEKQHPEWVTEKSPTQKVNESVVHEAVSSFKTVPHRNPMLSLANTYSREEIEEFIKRMHKLMGHMDLTFSCELKMDGVAISALYENGEFVRGVTRGDGKKGEDITANMKTIEGLPLKLPLKKHEAQVPELLEVRGEVYMTHATFTEINAQKAKAGEPLWANPRNAAAGSLKLLDAKEAKKRRLSVVFYAVSEESSGTLKSQSAAFDYLKQFGFPTLEMHATCHTLDEIWQFAEDVSKRRLKLAYDIDGIVIKVDSLKEQARLGNTGKSPRWAVAYKFAAEQATTRILSISVQVGRTGILTPVAELVPVFLAGSTIARTTLHNEDEIRRKDIRVGDQVTIEKGGDVIPKVVSVDLDSRHKESHPWKMPTHCPSCKTLVVKMPGEVAHRCPNILCPDQNLRRLIYFSGKDAMDIENMGEKVVEQLSRKGFVNVPSDIYRLTKDQLYQLEGFKEKSVNNLIESIDKSRAVSLDRFIMALGIKHIGSETAELLARRAGSIETFMEMTKEDLMGIRGIGEKMADAIVDFFGRQENQQEVRTLLALGVKPQELKAMSYADNAFKDKVFVITGTLKEKTRDKASALIKERGGKVSDSISKKTDFVIVGETPGSKLEKAKALGVKILDEEAFMQMLE